VIDRPKVLGQVYMTREYVQPQWVYDCINIRALIPTHEYGVGKKLPPHLRYASKLSLVFNVIVIFFLCHYYCHFLFLLLHVVSILNRSPFVDDVAKGYIPDYRKKLEQYYQDYHGAPSGSGILSAAGLEGGEEEEEDESDEEEGYAKALAREAQGHYDEEKGDEKPGMHHQFVSFSFIIYILRCVKFSLHSS
jgi:hypothetical protein